ncbi:SIMPL domain-containing protein [Pseudaeromonas sharmana]|uniref:SIMPL domain-containing protein n=1 Tax=Pseudaeromonas sharmana TaxID=328412 RepID=A0ABV8CR58_9GAMM
MLIKRFMAGFCAVAIMMSTQAQELGLPSSAHLVTRGQASMSVPADMATVSFAISLQDADAQKARQEADRRVAAFVNALEAAGFNGKDVVAGNLQLNPDFEYSDKGIRRQLGYQAVRDVSIRIYQLERVGQLIDVALKAGLNSVNQIEYGVRDAERYRKQVREQALADSRNTAADVAKSYAASLGKVYSIQYLPTDRAVRPLSAVMNMKAEGQSLFQPQAVNFEDTVTVVYLME